MIWPDCSRTEISQTSYVSMDPRTRSTALGPLLEIMIQEKMNERFCRTLAATSVIGNNIYDRLWCHCQMMVARVRAWYHSPNSFIG